MSSPTFYVSVLNPETQVLGEAGLFDGAVTPPEATTSTLAIDIPLADIKSHFKFKSVGDASDDGTISNIDITGVIGVATTLHAAWTFPADDVPYIKVLQDEFVSILATGVFGSAAAGDLFSNRSAVEASWYLSASVNALASLKAKTYTGGVNASKELIDAMFYSSNAKALRFSMAYDADTDLAVTTSGAVGSFAVTGGSGTGANVDVTTTGISVTTIGSGYVAGDSITIGTLSFKINSVQAAMLNGTLDNAAGTEVPLYVGDKINVIFSINSKEGQLDVNGEAIIVYHRFNVIYTLTA